jgi:hypothetical protein
MFVSKKLETKNGVPILDEMMEQEVEKAKK